MDAGSTVLPAAWTRSTRSWTSSWSCDPEKLGRLSMTPGFQRLTMQAGVCLDGVGIVSAVVDAGAMRSMAALKEAIADLV